MGSPLGPMLANIFVGYYELKVLTNAAIVQPTVYFRYVDDTFCLFECKEDSKAFLDELSKLHNKLQFTCEEEINRSLPFLDVLVERSNQQFVTSVYRKPTFTGDYMAWKSFCPPKRKTNLIACLVKRALRLCSDEKVAEEMEKIREIFLNLGYPDAVITRSIETTQSNATRVDRDPEPKSPVYLRLPYLGPISSRYENVIRKSVQECYESVQMRIIYKTRSCITENTKEKLPSNHQSKVIYKYVCHCESVYVGQTQQQLRQRVHRHVPRKFMKRTGEPQLTTAIGQHLDENDACRRNYDDNRFTILTKARTPHHLNVLEAIFIQTLKPILCVQKLGVYNTILFRMLK